ncbi:MAG: 2-oxoacid:acceptor oxidoreductase family protein [Deltaproteobacteria bacterium]|nr:MAG: 2-oxoacid:acceptor oxidoreductase family protein [Deltaproteobacteria bacterium]
MIEVRIHGRGGQGAVTSAELMALAAIEEGKFAQAMPSFGPERRGAPVVSYLRISEQERIRIRSEVIQPDIVVVLDPSLLKIIDFTAGLKQEGQEGMIVINTRQLPDEIKSAFRIESRVAVVNATKIARETLGVPITNTTMMGALIRATGIVELDSLAGPIQERFSEMLAQKNLKAVQAAYEKTLIEE